MAGMFSETWRAWRRRSGPALHAVGVDRRPAAAEVGDDVHEHRRGGQRVILDPDDVVDRLERGPGLAPAVLEDVELGLELLVALQVEAGASRVRITWPVR